MTQVVCAWNFCGHILHDQGQLFQQIIVCWQCFLYFLLYMLKASGKKKRLNGNVICCLFGLVVIIKPRLILLHYCLVTHEVISDVIG